MHGRSRLPTAIYCLHEPSSLLRVRGCCFIGVARLYAFEELLPSPQPAQVEVIEWFPSLDLFRPGARVSMSTNQIVYVQDLTLQHMLEHATVTNRTATEYRVQKIEAGSEQTRINLRRVGDGVSVSQTDRVLQRCMQTAYRQTDRQTDRQDRADRQKNRQRFKGYTVSVLST